MPTVKKLGSLRPDEPKHHHVGSPPTGFKNPWPSFSDTVGGLPAIFKAKFGGGKPPFVPVPDRSELVPIRNVEFSNPDPGFKVTWIGHASFLLQTSKADGASRGINLLCDPVFSERTSPVSFLGPKRYSPTPCTLEELLDNVEIDAVLISHNHYDHADAATLKAIWQRRHRNVHFFVALNNPRWLVGMGVDRSAVVEMDWWDQVEFTVTDVGSVRISCTPTQHSSARSPFDKCYDLWCSFAIEDLAESGSPAKQPKKLFFAGDTAYRTILNANATREEEGLQPACPAFKQVGDLLGPFDLALLPIGLCSPRVFMSSVHANPWDSIRIHQDLKSMRSIGMHWGTVRGGISAEYEDVRTPPKQWRVAAEEAGLKWGDEIGLMDIGETISLS